MSRVETRIRTLYQFDELTEHAKQKARYWYRQVDTGDSFFNENIRCNEYEFTEGGARA